MINMFTKVSCAATTKSMNNRRIVITKVRWTTVAIRTNAQKRQMH